MYKVICVYSLLSSVCVWAEPTVNIETTYYIVQGNNAKSIRADMNAKRKGKFDAWTTWYVKWRFYFNNTPHNCTINRVTTDVSVNFILPKLSPDNVADNETMQRWNRYYKALIDHENGHKNYGVEAARKIESELLSLGRYNDCNTLTTLANSRARGIIKTHNELNKQYDKDTQHGMKYGATFP